MKTYVEELYMREAVIAMANAVTETRKQEAMKEIFKYRRALADKTGLRYAGDKLDEMIYEIL